MIILKLIYTKRQFKVFYSEDHKNYVVLNMKKPFNEGHTHTQHYNQTLYMIDCVIKNKIPKKCNKYFLVSLTRLAKDKKYIERIERILSGEEPKQSYRNVPKNFRR